MKGKTFYDALQERKEVARKFQEAICKYTVKKATGDEESIKKAKEEKERIEQELAELDKFIEEGKQRYYETGGFD